MKQPSMQQTWPLEHSRLIERARSAQMSAVLNCHRSDHLIHQVPEIHPMDDAGEHADPAPRCAAVLQAVMQTCAAAQVELARSQVQAAWFERQLATTATDLSKANDEIALLRRQLESQTATVRDLETELAATHQEMADLNAEIQTYVDRRATEQPTNGHRLVRTRTDRWEHDRSSA